MDFLKKLIFLSTILFCITPIFAATSTEEETSGVERYAIYIGSNKGGKNREQLLYDGSDAMNFQKTMSEIGGVSEGNSLILIDPNKEKILMAKNIFKEKMKLMKLKGC